MGRIVSLDELEELAAAERAVGRSIALANGCFDLLHVGHLRYLQAAAAEADCLVVAINDDRSVRELKGVGRPIMPEVERVELIAAVRGVDYVTVFAGRTVVEVIRRLRPNVHCKGTDYSSSSVPERDIVVAYGARIAIVGDPKDHSTRDLLARIARGVHND